MRLRRSPYKSFGQPRTEIGPRHLPVQSRRYPWARCATRSPRERPRAVSPSHPSHPRQHRTEFPSPGEGILEAPEPLSPPSPRPAPPHAARPHRLPRAAGHAPRRRPANPEGRCGRTRSGRSRPVAPASRPRSGRALHAWRAAVGSSAAANGGAAPQSCRALPRAVPPLLSRRRSGRWRPCPAAPPRLLPPGVPGGAAELAKPAHPAPAALVTIVDWRPRRARVEAAASERARRAAGRGERRERSARSGRAGPGAVAG